MMASQSPPLWPPGRRRSCVLLSEITRSSALAPAVGTAANRGPRRGAVPCHRRSASRRRRRHRRCRTLVCSLSCGGVKSARTPRRVSEPCWDSVNEWRPPQRAMGHRSHRREQRCGAARLWYAAAVVRHGGRAPAGGCGLAGECCVACGAAAAPARLGASHSEGLREGLQSRGALLVQIRIASVHHLPPRKGSMGRRKRRR